jgi:hypothetical protein
VIEPFLTKITGTVRRYWQKSPIFLTTVAIVSLLLSIASFAFLALGFNVVGASWVVWFAFAAIIFGGAACARLVEDRKDPAFHLIADIERSFWTRVPRLDGNPGSHSQIVLHFRVTNNTRGLLLLSSAKLVRPRLWGTRRTYVLSTLNPLLETYSSETHIHARATTKASLQFIIERDMDSKGRSMTIIVAVGDQRGSIQRLKIRRLEYRPGSL